MAFLSESIAKTRPSVVSDLFMCILSYSSVVLGPVFFSCGFNGFDYVAFYWFSITEFALLSDPARSTIFNMLYLGFRSLSAL
jgi:hypothetical protein